MDVRGPLVTRDQCVLSVLKCWMLASGVYCSTRIEVLNFANTMANTDVRPQSQSPAQGMQSPIFLHSRLRSTPAGTTAAAVARSEGGRTSRSWRTDSAKAASTSSLFIGLSAGCADA